MTEPYFLYFCTCFRLIGLCHLLTSLLARVRTSLTVAKNIQWPNISNIQDDDGGGSGGWRKKVAHRSRTSVARCDPGHACHLNAWHTWFSTFSSMMVTQAAVSLTLGPLRLTRHAQHLNRCCTMPSMNTFCNVFACCTAHVLFHSISLLWQCNNTDKFMWHMKWCGSEVSHVTLLYAGTENMQCSFTPFLCHEQPTQLWGYLYHSYSQQSALVLFMLFMLSLHLD